MSRCHVRCRKCGARRVLPRHPDEYLAKPAKCGCGAVSWRPDKWMNNRKTGLYGMGCNCAGYWFMHRRGSLYCWNRADGTQRHLGDPDFHDRHYTDEELAQMHANSIFLSEKKSD